MAKLLKEEQSHLSRKDQYDALVEQALKRPGVREVVNVYQDWREKDQKMDSYRELFTSFGRITNSNSSNPG